LIFPLSPKSSRIWRRSDSKPLADSAFTVTEKSTPILRSEPDLSFGMIFVPNLRQIAQPSAGEHKAWSKRLRLLPLNVFNRLEIFIIRIDFAETLIFHKDSIVGVNEIDILPRIKDEGVCEDIFIRNE